MNTSIDEGLNLYKSIGEDTIPSDVTVICAVPMTHLHPVLAAKSNDVAVAAQNCHFENSGAFTGETSPAVLADMGVDYVLVGHSERREYNHEDNQLLAKKLDAGLANGLKVIFCCGEALDIRKAGNQNEYVENQIKESLFHLSAEAYENVVVAYEPIWAIGTGETASPEQAQDMHKHLRGVFAAKYGNAIADSISILYGGSVKPANAKEIFGQPDVDGGLVGGASLKADSFKEIIHSF